MHRLVLPLLLAAALPAVAAAQPTAPGGASLSAPPGYTAAPALGDSATAVFAEDGSAASAAALGTGTERAPVIQRLRGVLAGAALGHDPAALRWRMVGSAPASPFDVYHERWIGSAGDQAVVVAFHHLRKDGRDLLVGTAFRATPTKALLREPDPMTFHVPTRDAAGFLVAALVGDPPFVPTNVREIAVDEDDFVGQGTSGSATEREDDPDEGAVRSAFGAYRAALLARDGRAALSHVSEAVFEYYGDVQRAALYATADEVRARPLTDQLFVLLLRARVPVERLRAMTPRELFAHAVEQGWISERATREQQVGRVFVTGSMATAVAMQGGRDSGMRFAFVRQDGAWKWDMLGSVQLMDPVIRQLAESNGLTPEALMVRMVEGVTGRAVAPTLWDPPAGR